MKILKIFTYGVIALLLVLLIELVLNRQVSYVQSLMIIITTLAFCEWNFSDENSKPPLNSMHIVE